jgi:DtxR family manganese transport transcriptional regulator
MRMTRTPRSGGAVEEVSEGQRAEQFRSTRRAHETETAEDYVELIADLIETAGEARSVEIAARLGVSGPTVTKTVSRLQRDGLVESRPYRSIFLTETGWDMAKRCRRRHRIVLEFLLSLGVDEETARTDAEGMEHHVSDKTLAVFEHAISERSSGADHASTPQLGR